MTKQMPILQAAEYYNVSERTLRRRIESGQATGRKVKGRWLVDVEQGKVDNSAASRRQNADLPGQNSTVADHADLIEQLKSEVEHLRETNRQLLNSMDESKSRSDTIVMKLMHQIESQQFQLEEAQRPKPFMARLKAVFMAD
ncbi:MAG: hypothetical protein QGH37_32200 [Candidatus Poribacteria bacterium]|jgi:hypothetical protein|nr:hypothetical protein [Candidatus Poribacteria bacterium]